MTKPKRIQLSRRKGFNLQKQSLELNGLPAVSVARGANRKWGNPFIVGEYVTKAWERIGSHCLVRDNEDAARSFRFMLRVYPRKYPNMEEILEGLSGKNLACWCALDAPCHADELLKFIEQQEGV